MPAYFALHSGPPRKADWYKYQAKNATNADKFPWFHPWHTFFCHFCGRLSDVWFFGHRAGK
jgi:hypothetical protein